MVIFRVSQRGSLQMNKDISHGPTGNHIIPPHFSYICLLGGQMVDVMTRRTLAMPSLNSLYGVGIMNRVLIYF